MKFYYSELKVVDRNFPVKNYTRMVAVFQLYSRPKLVLICHYFIVLSSCHNCSLKFFFCIVVWRYNIVLFFLYYGYIINVLQQFPGSTSAPPLCFVKVSFLQNIYSMLCVLLVLRVFSYLLQFTMRFVINQDRIILNFFFQIFWIAITIYNFFLIQPISLPFQR